MNTNNISQTTAAGQPAGNPETSTLTAAVESWYRHWSHPDDYAAFCHLADKTALYLAERFPEGSLRKPLKGREKEAQAETLLLLLDRYLRGRKALITNSIHHRMDRMALEFARAAGGAWRTVVWEMEKAHHRQLAKASEAEYLALAEDPRKSAPHLSLSFWSLPIDHQLRLVFAGLQAAVREGHLPEQTNNLVTRLLRDGITPSQLARQIGISPQAVYQRLKKAGRHLKARLNDQEFGL